jgi:hypothetical protein
MGDARKAISAAKPAGFIQFGGSELEFVIPLEPVPIVHGFTNYGCQRQPIPLEPVPNYFTL